MQQEQASPLSTEFLTTHKLEMVKQTPELILLRGHDSNTVLIERLPMSSHWACVTDCTLPRPVYINLQTNAKQFQHPFHQDANMELLSISSNITKAVANKKKQVDSEDMLLCNDSAAMIGTVIGNLLDELAKNLWRSM